MPTDERRRSWIFRRTFSQTSGLSSNASGRLRYRTHSRRNSDAVPPTSVFIENSSEAKTCALSENGDRCAVGCDNGKVLIWDTFTGNKRVFQGHTDGRGIGQVSLTPDGTICASASNDGTVGIYDADTLLEHAVLQQPNYRWATGVALSSNMQYAVASFIPREHNEDRGLIMRHNIGENRSTILVIYRYKIFEIATSDDATRILFLRQGGVISVVNAPHEGAPVIIQSFDYMRNDFFAAMDVRAEHIVIAEKTLQIRSHFYNDPVIVTVNDYSLQSPPRVAITYDGSRFIEQRGKTVLVRSSRSGHAICKLAHDIRLSSCTISGDGATVIACDVKGALVIWRPEQLSKTISLFDLFSHTPYLQLPSGSTTPSLQISPPTSPASIYPTPPETPPVIEEEPAVRVPVVMQEISPIEAALRKVLTGMPIDAYVLATVLKPEHVVSRNALYAGHTLVLIAIRTAVLSPAEIATFNGVPFFLFENLYLPVAKFYADESPEGMHLIKEILNHAAHIGLIQSAEPILASADLYSALNVNYQRVNAAIEDLSHAVGVLEYAVTQTNERVNEVEEASKKQLAYISTLAENLSTLHTIMKRRDRVLMYANIAKCILCVLPLVGSLIGHAVSSAADVVLNLSAEDLMSFGSSVASSGVDHLANVDVSNIQVLSFALSRKGYLKSGSSSEAALRKAVEDSSFKAVDELNNMLQEEAQRMAENEPSVHMLNLGDSKWKSPSPRQSDVYTQAVNLFEAKLKHSNKSTITLDGAKDILELICRGMRLGTNFNEEEAYETMDEELRPGCNQLSKELFATVAESYVQKLMDEVDHIPQDWREKFREATDEARTAGFYVCRRLLMQLWREERAKSSSDIDAKSEMPSKEEIDAVLSQFDRDGDRILDESKFIDAARAILVRRSARDACCSSER